MTLVVGRADGPRVAVASDTLITEHDRPLPLQDGVVKARVLLGHFGLSRLPEMKKFLPPVKTP